MGLHYKQPSIGFLKRFRIGPFFIARERDYVREYESARILLCDGMVFMHEFQHGAPPDPWMVDYWKGRVGEALYPEKKR